jgi:hypothetical protein
MTSGEVTVETGKSQFIFYPSIFVCNLLISDSWSSLLLLPLLDVGPWAYSTIHGPRRLFVKARAGPGLSPTVPARCGTYQTCHAGVVTNEIDLQRPPASFIMQIIQIASAEVNPARTEVGVRQEDSPRARIIRGNPCYLVAAVVLA